MEKLLQRPDTVHQLPLVLLAVSIALLLLFSYFMLPIRFFRSLSKANSKAARCVQETAKCGDVIVEIYRNPTKITSTLMVVVGLHPKGIYDPRFRKFAQTCAAAGFFVVAPDLEDFRNVKVSTESPHQIAYLLNHLHECIPQEARNNVGVLGISYGAGPVFVGAAEAETQNRPKFLISVGGYYDFAHFLTFVVRGMHESNGEVHSRAAQYWGRVVFTLNYLDDFTTSERAEVRDVLLLHLNDQVQEAQRATATLSRDSQTFIHEVVRGFSERNLQIFRNIMTRDRAKHVSLSPAFILDKLDAQMRFYLVHGKNDDLVPYEETLEMDEGLRKSGHKNVYALTTHSLTHVDLKEPEDLKGAVAMIFWLRRVLSEAK